MKVLHKDAGMPFYYRCGIGTRKPGVMGRVCDMALSIWFSMCIRGRTTVLVCYGMMENDISDAGKPISSYMS